MMRKKMFGVIGAGLLMVACGGDVNTTPPNPELESVLKNALATACNDGAGNDLLNTPYLVPDATGMTLVAASVPTCVRHMDGTVECSAPAIEWLKEHPSGDVASCWITQCGGLDPKKVIWTDLRTGSQVMPYTKPMSLPKSAGGFKPKGGGGICNDPLYYWQFKTP